MGTLTLDELSAGAGPAGWRRPLGPVGLLWVVTATAAAVLGQRGWHRVDRLDHAVAETSAWLGRHGWPAAVVAAVLLVTAWAAAGLLSLAGGRILEYLWLVPGWGRPGAAFRDRRRARWTRAATAAETARAAAVAGPVDGRPGQLVTFREQSRRRNRVALAEPERPGWMADRIAALETRVAGQYGIDLATVWPRLWLILPESAKQDLRAARVRWGDATTWAAWGLLFSAVGAGWWPSLAIGGGLLGAGWLRARAALDGLANLIEAAVDVHAAELARRLAVALPPDGRVDHHTGQIITSLVRKGT